MKTTLSLLAASTAVSLAIALPAWSAMTGPATVPVPALFEVNGDTLPLVRTSMSGQSTDQGKYEEGEEGEYDEDEDEEEEEYEDEDEYDEGEYGAKAMMDPAPAGTVQPPQNGLFGNGAAPKVEMK